MIRKVRTLTRPPPAGRRNLAPEIPKAAPGLSRIGPQHPRRGRAVVGATPDLQVGGRIAVRVPHRALLPTLWVVAAVAEVLALRPVLFDTDAPIDWLAVGFALVGGSFAAFGLIAWRKRPDTRGGALMTATGFGFFASALLGQLDAPLAFTAGLFLADIWVFPFVALLLTLLTAGRLTR